MFFGRGKNKIQDPYTYIDTYKVYVEDIDKESPYYISYEEYRDICRRFYKAVMKEIMDRGYTFKMPFNLGTIHIDKKKIRIDNKRKLAIDWELTNKHGKVIYHLNEHSRGFRYIFHWGRWTHTLKNKNFYRFVPSRANKRKLAKMIKSGDYDYFENRG